MSVGKVLDPELTIKYVWGEGPGSPTPCQSFWGGAGISNLFLIGFRGVGGPGSHTMPSLDSGGGYLVG